MAVGTCLVTGIKARKMAMPIPGPGNQTAYLKKHVVRTQGAPCKHRDDFVAYHDIVSLLLPAYAALRRQVDTIQSQRMGFTCMLQIDGMGMLLLHTWMALARPLRTRQLARALSPETVSVQPESRMTRSRSLVGR